MATRPIRYDAGARNVLGSELVPCSMDPPECRVYKARPGLRERIGAEDRL